MTVASTLSGPDRLAAIGAAKDRVELIEIRDQAVQVFDRETRVREAIVRTQVDDVRLRVHTTKDRGIGEGRVVVTKPAAECV